MNRTRPVLNKFVLQKELEIIDTYHQLNMREMKPITARLMEHAEAVVINHSKRQKIQEVREIEIERENQSLLSKMSSVISKDGSYSPNKIKNFRTKLNRSLNQIYRKKQEENIAIENQHYFARIFNKKPTLNLEKIDRDWKNNKKVMKKMSNRQFNLTLFRPKQTPNRSYLSSSIQIKKRIQYTNLSRIMVLDGHRMQITIQYTNGFLKIIGDPLGNSRKFQIIQIPKEQAVLFIRQDCDGKIQNIFEKLRYDGQSQILYIVGNIDESQQEMNPQAQPDKKQRIPDQKAKQIESNIDQKLEEKPVAAIEQVVVTPITIILETHQPEKQRQPQQISIKSAQNEKQVKDKVQQHKASEQIVETPQKLQQKPFINEEMVKTNPQPMLAAEEKIQNKQIESPKHEIEKPQDVKQAVA